MSQSPTTRSPSAVAPAAPPLDAALQLRRAVEALGAAGTGRYLQTTTFLVGDTRSVLTQQVSFQLAPERWAAHLKLEQQGRPDVAPGGFDLRYVEEAFYVQSLDWTGDRRGRWFQLRGTKAAGGLLVSAATGPVPHGVLAVRAMTPFSASRKGADIEISGDLPAAVALRVLGVVSGLAKLRLVPDSFTGKVPARLTLDADGHIRRLVVQGGLAMVEPALPRDTIAVVRGSTAELTFDGLGTAVLITAPPPSSILPDTEASAPT